MSENHRSVPGSPLALSKSGVRRRAWVQSLLAIAAGSLFIALYFVVLRGSLLLKATSGFTITTLVLLTVLQLSLTTTGGYITALLAPSHPPSSLCPRLAQHALGLATVAAALCLLSVLTHSGSVNREMHVTALIEVLSGISIGTWLRDRQCA